MAHAAMRPGWPLDWLRERFGYEPLDLALFEAALTHRSASGRNNERLEFLGDAVLNLVAADRLYRRYPVATEGDLSRLRARVVSAEPLAGIAQEIGLGDELQLGSGELKTGGFRRQSILADALEALIGAVYLDRGMEPARQFVERLLESRIAAAPEPADLKDPKTRLQEWLQARSLPLPAYEVEASAGSRTSSISWSAARPPRLGRRRLVPARVAGAPNRTRPSSCWCASAKGPALERTFAPGSPPWSADRTSASRRC